MRRLGALALGITVLLVAAIAVLPVRVSRESERAPLAALTEAVRTTPPGLAQVSTAVGEPTPDITEGTLAAPPVVDPPEVAAAPEAAQTPAPSSLPHAQPAPVQAPRIPAFFDPGPQPAPAGIGAAPPGIIPGTPVPGGGLVLHDGGNGSANVDDSYTHWGTYRWGGVEAAGKIRAFYLFDRTGDASLHGLIAAWANYINYLRANWLPGLPYVAYYQDDANVGSCGNFQIVGYSFATACVRQIDNSYGRTTFVRQFEGPSSHFNGPYVEIDRQDLPTFNAQKDLINHEFGHLLGLGHSSNPESIMCVPACGFPAPGTGPPRLYDIDDARGFAFLYYSHAAGTEPY